MRVLITGAAGFLGSLLTDRLLSMQITIGGAAKAPIDELILVDRIHPPAEHSTDGRVRVVVGDLNSALARIRPVDAIFHLAGVVSGQAERDFDSGMRTNLDGTRKVLEWARAHERPPVLVFTSSLAVFGSDPHVGPLTLVDEDTVPRPQSSYGVQKFICEQLVADYSRRGYIDGRSVRLMTVVVRPGAPNAAASSFLSGIVREPLSGSRAVCPVRPDLPVAISSPQRTIDGIVAAVETPLERWGSRCALNLPALTTTPLGMITALERRAGSTAASLVSWEADREIEEIVGSWPSCFSTTRAEGLGLSAPPDFDSVLAEYIATATESASNSPGPDESSPRAWLRGVSGG